MTWPPIRMVGGFCRYTFMPGNAAELGAQILDDVVHAAFALGARLQVDHHFAVVGAAQGRSRGAADCST